MYGQSSDARTISFVPVLAFEMMLIPSGPGRKGSGETIKLNTCSIPLRFLVLGQENRHRIVPIVSVFRYHVYLLCSLYRHYNPMMAIGLPE